MFRRLFMVIILVVGLSWQVHTEQLKILLQEWCVCRLHRVVTIRKETRLLSCSAQAICSMIFPWSYQRWNVRQDLRARAHERFFAAAVKQPQRPIVSWLCARTAKERLRSHVFLTIWCSQCVRYTNTRHLLCRTIFYDHTLAEMWMLSEVYIITD